MHYTRTYLEIGRSLFQLEKNKEKESSRSPLEEILNKQKKKRTHKKIKI